MQRLLFAMLFCVCIGCGDSRNTENTGAAPEPLKGAPPGMGPPGQGPVGVPNIPKQK